VLIFRSLNWSNVHSIFLGKAKSFFLYALFIFLSTHDIFPNFLIDFKIVLLILAVGCSWISFFLSFPKLIPALTYSFGTTFLSSRLIRKIPGTITSLWVFSLFFLGFNEIKLEYRICVFILLLLVHFSCFNSFLKLGNYKNDDPNVYTLDETLAIAMAWVLLGEMSIVRVVILFILFRFFDIFKPLGIRKIEKQVKWCASLRNLADDFLAMAYSLFIFRIIEIYVG